MKEVKIQIVDVDLDEMGVKQDPKYTPLRFPDSAFYGYWVGEGGIDITFYVGNSTFICRNCKKNIDIFESILNEV
jgi:hypothetical protein